MNVRFSSNKDQIAAFVKLYNYNIAPCLHFNLVPALLHNEKLSTQAVFTSMELDSHLCSLHFHGTYLENNTNPVLLDSGAPLKCEFCMLKNTTQADF